ncbi:MULTISPECIES: DUF433 domain-containing protein [unclassified Robiginitalea]|uniref:DUF433 domain-containing protein n=1 Tax=Robiginitalea TaxID=252306 RepID=UPI00234B41A5|nr:MULTISPECIES: DUF433 domain-containing protein [unclassified Robiginitalea]MDC6353277.1 DUF433 domain-containing protein [Robiginitalea sp. PM2]MDC6373557.1 DUF433 domain-containing protein [Robiginitalea sp. SP8]
MEKLMDFENEPKLGLGSYTSSDIAKILRIPYQKVYTWMNKYWDEKLGQRFNTKYSWEVDGTRAVSFHTFIEFYVMMKFAEAGVKPKEVLKAHNDLTKFFRTAFPFAKKEVLEGIRSDGKHIFLETKLGTVELNGTKQFNLDFIKLFFVKLDFGEDNLANRFWPLGKERHIVVDPKRKFGSPVLKDYNIYPETFYGLHKGGESVEVIAKIYEVPLSTVRDAIEYCEAA